VNGDTFNASFYYEENASAIYLFQNEELTSAGDTRFIRYLTLPDNFAVIPFYLESDQAIDSYSLTQADPLNGITNHSQVGAGKIQFEILRNSQHYLELNILTSTNTGWYGNLYIVNQNIGSGGRYFIFSASDDTGAINVTYQQVNAGGTYTIEVLIGNRLPTMNSEIYFQVDSFQQDSAGYDNAEISGATYSGYLYSSASITGDSAGTNITINIPVDNDT
jgi:hypothetical protein